jgi:glucose/arabinose dehydrogenase
MRTAVTLSFVAAVAFASLRAQTHNPASAFAGQTRAPAPAQASAPFTVQTLATGLTGAWAIAFLPDGKILVTQNAGTMARSICCRAPIS